MAIWFPFFTAMEAIELEGNRKLNKITFYEFVHNFSFYLDFNLLFFYRHRLNKLKNLKNLETPNSQKEIMMKPLLSIHKLCQCVQSLKKD